MESKKWEVPPPKFKTCWMNVASEWTQQINKLSRKHEKKSRIKQRKKNWKIWKVKIPGKKKKAKVKHTCYHSFQKIRVVLLEEIIRIF